MTDSIVTKGRSNFDKVAYKDHDERGKLAAQKFFEKLGYSIETNPDTGRTWDYKCPDLIATDTDKPKVFIEAQINKNWEGEGRPTNWGGFQCWGRKLDQMQYPNPEAGEKMYWMTESNNLKYAVFCPHTAAVKKLGVRPNPRYGKCANMKPREMYASFSLADCWFADLETGDLEPFVKPQL